MEVLKGSTDVTTYFVLRLAATGVEATGLTIANIDLQYTRNRVAPTAKVDAQALAATDTAHTDNFAIEIDATDQPGLYRVDWPDAAFASGVDKVVLTVKCATVFTEHLQIDLVNFNSQDGVRGGLTALPNAAADAAGGLPISDAGGLDLDAKLAATNEVTAARMAVLTQLIQSAKTIVEFTCDASSTTTSVIALTIVPTASVNDQFNGRIMVFTEDTTTVALRGQATDITDFDFPTMTFSVTALTTAPVSGDTAVIL